MNHVIENEALRVTVSSMGAEMISAVDKNDGTEYVWQGDATYWTGHAYNLFPICGRLTEGKYTYKGATYEMNLHGFARKTEYDILENKGDEMTFILKSSNATRAIYPFDFTLTITYKLDGRRLDTCIKVVNEGGEVMYFAVGGHPGFNLPIAACGVFEDYCLKFDEKCEPKKLKMSATCYYAGENEDYPIENGDTIRLRHDLFDNDAIFLTDVSRGVTLKSDKTDRHIRLDFPGMKYVGIWHAPKTEAPYVCVEPWTSIPADDGVIDDLETKRDMTRLGAGESYENTFSITFA